MPGAPARSEIFSKRAGPMFDARSTHVVEAGVDALQDDVDLLCLLSRWPVPPPVARVKTHLVAPTIVVVRIPEREPTPLPVLVALHCRVACHTGAAQREEDL